MGIGRKLTLLVGVPQLGLVASAGEGVRSAAEQAVHAEQARLVVVAASRAGQLAAALEQIQIFTTVDGPAWAAQVQPALSGPQTLTAQQVQDAVARTPARGRLRVNRQVWSAAVDARVARLHEVSQSFEAPSGASGRTRRLAVVDA